ncbi:MAG: hypothetical protein KC518_14805, partial [Candidatus Cloacimonetes bacterium]|nr:hypothetical protein [Candidatus Cloacimonadota bacterium]
LCGEWPGLVTVVMTGYPSLETCLDAMQLGAYGYLVKPFKVEAVVEMLERGRRERTLRSEVDSLRAQVRDLERRLKDQPGEEK